ncbi:MAG: hypothetical protein Q7S24_01965 [bacterium]|nr:hypothetical protein [bacterium]
MDNPELAAELAKIAAAQMTKQVDSPPQPEKDTELVVSIEELIPGINTEGLKTLDEIRQGTPLDETMERAGNAFPTEYQQHYRNGLTYLSPAEDIGRLLFKDQVVVELGAGKEYGGIMVSEKFGAKGHVAVELHHAQELLKHVDSNTEFVKKLQVEHPERIEFSPIPISVAAEDMLTFLRRLPDHSVSIYMSGIDGAILGDGTYRNDVAKEIERVLSPNGGCISNHTFIDEEYARKGTQLQCVKDQDRNDLEGSGMWKTAYLTTGEMKEHAPTREEVKGVIRSVYSKLGETIIRINEVALIKEFRIWKNMEEIRVRNSKDPSAERFKLFLDTCDLLRELEPEFILANVSQIPDGTRFKYHRAPRDGDEQLVERAEALNRWNWSDERRSELGKRLGIGPNHDYFAKREHKDDLYDIVLKNNLEMLGDAARNVERPPQYYLDYLNREFYSDKDKNKKIKEKIKEDLLKFFYR